MRDHSGLTRRALIKTAAVAAPFRQGGRAQGTDALYRSFKEPPGHGATVRTLVVER
jgi:hypothetical protein